MKDSGAGLANTIQSYCQQRTSMTVDDVVGDGKPTSNNFHEVREYISASLQLLKSLHTCDFSDVPNPTLEVLNRGVVALTETLVAMRQYHGSGRLEPTTRNTLIGSIKERYQSLFLDAAPIVGFAGRHSSDHQEVEYKARTLVANIEARLIEAKQILDRIKEVDTNVAVAREAKYFESEASSHRRGAYAWLFGTVVAAAVVLYVADYASKHPPVIQGNDSVALTIFTYIPRFIALSIAFYAMALCIRNYRAGRHNFIVNRHRALALTTFEAFVRSATDPKVKDAVLAQAASTIFSAQPSGYSVDQAEPLPQATAVELIQRITGK